MVTRISLFALVLIVTGCATQPARINNACAVFEEKGGWFNNWHRQSRRVEQEFGVPVPILMATIRTESGYRARVRPPRTKLLGFIPWTRPSDAYGYAQALSSTWEEYQQATGRPGADRNDFGDSVHFVGWYHHRSHERIGIPLDDAYSLYLAYYLGPTGYQRQAWKNKPGVRKAAQRMARRANKYQRQIRDCDL